MRSIKIIFVITFCFFVHVGVLAQTQSPSINETSLAYFQESYELCRDQFRSLALEIKQKVSRIQISRLPISSQRDEDLTIDLCYIPALKKSKLIIISCGVHGVEGFTGSAVQRMFMTEFLPKIDLENTGIFLIHGMNPYGFKYVRRVTENNVDLNRNCDVDKALFASKNEGYSSLAEFLNPEKQVDMNSMANQFFFVIDWRNTEGFYTVTGAFSGFIGKIVPGKFYIPMTFEYGTMDSHTTMGSVKSLHNMIIENQGFYYGYKTKDDEIEVKKKFREMYFPSSDEWRSEVIRQAREVFPLVIKRYQALDIK